MEQATHFCDLVRYLGGEVRRESVTGCCVPYASDPASPGYLSAVPESIDEESLAPSQRIPRFTTGTHIYIYNPCNIMHRKWVLWV